MIAMVVGLGSMGRRRSRLLLRIGDIVEVIGVDSREDRCNQAKYELGIKAYSSIGMACDNEEVDISVISTSPLSHATIISECLGRGLHVFTELNLVDTGYYDNIKMAARMNKVLFLSSTFMYREEINYIRKRVLGLSDKMHYSYHVGQYLPDWHPWEEYKDYFVANKKTNGCRELFAIELPWLICIFGEVVGMNVVKDKISSLEIDYCDSYIVTLEHSSGCKGSLMVDVVSRKAVRNFELVGEEIYIEWNGTPNGLKEYNIKENNLLNIDTYNNVEHEQGYSDNIVENAYYAELEEYINVIKGISELRYSFEKDMKILELIDRIEE